MAWRCAAMPVINGSDTCPSQAMSVSEGTRTLSIAKNGAGLALCAGAVVMPTMSAASNSLTGIVTTSRN